MELTNTQKSLLDADTQVLLEMGYLSPELKITDTLRHYLDHLAFVANKDAIVAHAKEKLAERKAKVQPNN